VSAGGCASGEDAVARCEPGERLGLAAQSVPDAAYVPCVELLLPGWSVASVEATDHRSSFTLRSDRAEAPVEVDLTSECDTRGATAVTPRAEAVRTLQRVQSISPGYAGTIFDVFPGGCVSYRFAFERGPHIALVDELQQIVGLYPRRQLRQELLDRLGLDIGA
jgi:hypothetical protein